jgi:hypothetical protein
LKEIEDVDIYMLGVLLLLLGMVGVMQVKMEEIEVWRASASTTI